MRPRGLAKILQVTSRRRVRLGWVCPVQAGIRAVGDAIWVVCVGLSKQVGTANAADDRQHARACDHCPLRQMPHRVSRLSALSRASVPKTVGLVAAA
jgi:hypothetical protein